MSAKNNETSLTTIDLKLVSAYSSEWKDSGRKTKPSFNFDMLGLREGTKLYCTGEKEPIAEIGKRPLLVRTNRVKLYCTGEEYKDLESAERAYKMHNQKPAKSCTGWRFFRAKVSDGKTDAVLTLRALWDLWPDIESALSGALASANAPKPAAKPAAKLSAKLSEKDERIAELERQLAELSKKPTRIIKK
jgi:hypothetical protein